MTSILFCRTCPDKLKCDGFINCPWLSLHDEANCSPKCRWPVSIPCDCNKLGNMTCEGRVGQSGHVCYSGSGKFFLFCVLL